MLLVLVPFTVLPLFILAGLLHLFIQRSFDEEVARRAKPEMAALARNLDTLEKRLLRQISSLVRSDEVKIAALTFDEPRLRARVKAWLDSSLFDAVRVYSFKGQPLLSFERKGEKTLAPSWQQIFNLPEKREAARLPATAEDASRLAVPSVESFVDPNSRFQSTSLTKLFMDFVMKESSWVLRAIDTSEGRSDFSFRVYRSIVDSDGQAAGYVEGILKMSSLKWEHLSLYQGVEFVIVDSQRKVLSSSRPEVAALLDPQLANWKTIETATDNFFPSRVVELDDYPVEFFFAPLTTLRDKAESWVGVGLSRSQHVYLQNRILIWVVGITLLLACVVVAFGFLTSEKLTEPISKLVAAAESVRAGKIVEPFRVDATKEIAYLVDRFNEMALSVQATKRTLEAKLEELAKTNDQLTQMQDQLVQSAKMSSLGQLVAGVAHELNNPIAFIYSNMVQMRQYLKSLNEVSDHLKSLRSQLSPEHQKNLDKLLVDVEWDYVRGDMADIVQSCLEGSIRVKDIVLGLRNFSRLDKGQVVDAEINEALKNTAKLLAGQMKNRIQVDWSLCEESWIRCNISQVNQVFMNIMVNGIQAIEGEGSLFVETKMLDFRGSEHIRIRIRDTGVGIPAEILSKIFDPFYTTKGVGEGTGLGLSIVYGIVQKHGGHIDVKSVPFPDPMHGSTFDIYLPKKGPAVDTSLDEAS
jgi:two-component system NtrC family sensor kinase